MDKDTSAAEWTTAYLEWIDAEPDLSREGVLLMALRTEAECVHMLRRALETDGAVPDTLRLAADVRALADKVMALQLH